jgi:hypothetical protein
MLYYIKKKINHITYNNSNIIIVICRDIIGNDIKIGRQLIILKNIIKIVYKVIILVNNY